MNNVVVQKYQFLVDNILDTIFEMDLNGKFIYISPQCVDLLGYHQNELVGSNILDYIHPEDISNVKKSLLKAIQSQNTFTSEFRTIHKNGNEIYISAKGHLVNANGKQSIVAVGRDINENKRIENILKESEEKYRLIIEHANDMIFILNERFEIEYVNGDIFKKIMGYTEDDLIGRNSIENIHPEDIKKVSTKLFKNFKSGLGNTELRIKDKNGNYHWQEVRGQGIIDSEGKKKAILIARDITDRKKTEEILKQSQELLNKITDQTFMGFAIFQDFDIKYFNLAFAEVIGYSQEEISKWKTREFFKIIHPDDKNKLISLAQNLYSGDNDALNFLHFRINKKSGQVIWVETQTKTIIYDNKEADMVFIQNITPKIEWEQKLKESEERYRLITEHANDLIDVLDEKFRYEYINEETHKRVLGFSKEDMIGKFAGKFVHPDEMQEISEKLRAGFAKGVEMSECRIRKKDGTYIWYESKGKIFKDSNGNKKALIMSRDITERRLAERKIRRSEALLSDAQRIAHLGHWEWNIQTNELFWSDELYRMYKRPRDYRPTIREWLTHVHPDDFEIYFKSLKENILDNEIYSKEFRIICTDGEIKHIHAEWEVDRDEKNKPIRAFGTILDITERKKTEQKLKESEEKYRLITENIYDMITVFNKNFKIEYANDHVHERLTGYTRDDLIGKSSLKYIHPDDLDRVFKEYQDKHDSGEGVIELRLKTKKGEYLWLEVKGRTFIDNDGEKKSILISRDISKRKKAEKKLKESEEKYRLISENANDLIVIINTKSIIEYINKRPLVRNFGYTPEEIIGKDIKVFINPKNLESYGLNVKNLFRREKGTIELDLRHKKGYYCPVEVIVSIFIDMNNEPKQLIFVRDISARKRAEQKLRESEEKYRLISEDADDLISLYDDNFNLEYINEQTHSRILGYSTENMKNLSFKIAITHKDDVDTIKNASRVCFRKGNVTYQMRLKHKNGHYLWFETKGKVFLGQDDQKKVLFISRDITERRIAEEELKAKESKYRTLIENLPQRIFLKDNNSSYISCNNKYAEDLQIKADDIMGKTDLDFYPKELADKYRLDDARILSTGKAEEIDEKDILKGKERFVRTIKTPIRDKDGNITGILGIFWDVTERKKVQQQLQESEERFKIIFEHAPDAYFLNDLTGVFIDGNKSVESLFGYKREKLRGKDIGEFLPESQLPIASEILSKSKKGLKTGPDEIIVKHKDGREIPIEVRSHRIAINDQQLVLGIARDITERKKAEQKLRESEEKYRLITENANELIALLNEKFEHEFINEQTYLNVLGYDKYDMLGKTRWDFIHPEDFNKSIEALKLGFEKGKGSVELRLLHKQGHYLWFEFKGKKFIDKEGKVKGLLIARDITERKKAEQKLKESEEKFRRLFKGSPLFTIAWRRIDNDFIVVDYNSNAEKISEGQIRDDIGNAASDLYLKEQYRPDLIDDLNRCFSEKSTFTVEKKVYVDFVNSERELRTICNYVPPDLVLTHIEDITGRKMAEQKLRESEEKYRNIIENAKEGYFEVDLKGNFTLCNDAMCKLFEYPREELIGMNYKHCTTEEMKKEAYEAFNTVYKTGIDQESFEYEVITKNNKTIFGETTIHLRFDTEGNVMGFSGFMRDITEKKRAEMELRESEEKLRTLFEVTPVSIILSDLESNILMCNQKFCELHRIKSPDIIKGRKVPEFISEKDRPKLKESLNNTFAGIPRPPKEYTMIREDGTEFQAEATSSGIKDKNGNIIGLIGVAQDITERKRAEEKLIESEEKFRHLFEHSPFSIVLFDSTGRIIDCNSAIEKIFGVNRQNLINQNYLQLSDIDSKQIMILKERIQQIMAGENVEPVELRIIRRDGIIRWINSSISKITIKNQTLLYSIIQDITERKILENLMFELNQVFFNFTADVRENIHLLLQTVSKLSKGKLVLYTRKFFDKKKQVAQIISSENEFYSHNVENFKKIYFMSEIFDHSHELPQVFSNLDENTQLRGDPFIQKHNIKGAYGKVINFQDKYNSAISILYQHNPEVSDEDQLILLLISDAIAIEEQRWLLLQKLEEQNKKLSDIDKLKSEFLRRISHELKTPLISIKGYSELILHHNKDVFDIDTISMIEEIIQGCSRLENLVIELLKTSKLETGQIELKTSVEDLAFLIRFTVKELHGLARTRNQKITLEIHDNLKTRFEKERIHEVVGNLLTNAIKYTPPYGMIEIKSEIRDKFYIISVKDNGIGFTQVEKEKVFKQFGKIEHYGRGSYISTEGTGLGLYITKKLVQLHGGEVWMESEGRNKGSIFYFSLPILKE